MVPWTHESSPNGILRPRITAWTVTSELLDFCLYLFAHFLFLGRALD